MPTFSVPISRPFLSRTSIASPLCVLVSSRAPWRSLISVVDPLWRHVSTRLPWESLTSLFWASPAGMHRNNKDAMRANVFITRLQSDCGLRRNVRGPRAFLMELEVPRVAVRVCMVWYGSLANCQMGTISKKIFRMHCWGQDHAHVLERLPNPWTETPPSPGLRTWSRMSRRGLAQ